LDQDEFFMKRCLELAQFGSGYVAPNPMVGAVLMYDGTIIGEGFHQYYGKEHAEVNCIASVKMQHRHLIEKSVLYVSLEPCSHYGKTPPCTNLILEKAIPKVVIGSIDINKEVAGKGVEKLIHGGVNVVTGVLEKECLDLNKRYFTFHQHKRPYIILKWAQSLNGMTGSSDRRVQISNPLTSRLVHKWRNEEAAILAGTNTIANDNPKLTTRLYPGKNPVRIILDKKLVLSPSSAVFNSDAKTIIFNNVKEFIEENLVYIKIPNEDMLIDVLQSLFEQDIQSVLIEGGTKTIQKFIDRGLWDEARTIVNKDMTIENGVPAPDMKNFQFNRQEKVLNDLVNYFYKIERL
jgi:diaminohydroxyphosphoribosylaminopyrimidine deaminase / 5-amino-6-(5-phosphoribosylamino)uracil reductase